MSRILVAEDEPGIAAFLAKGLRAHGFEVDIVEDGGEAAATVNDLRYDLMILDIGLPTKDGLEVLREIRERGERLPVVILTARDETSDTVAGLESGADDYMSKPFRFDELLARVRVRLRGADPQLLRRDVFTLDLHTHQANVDGTVVDLTAREFALAEVFLRQPDEVLSRDYLLHTVWGEDVEAGSNVVDVYVLYLRRKLGDHVIETVRGAGYRLGSANASAPGNGDVASSA